VHAYYHYTTPRLHLLYYIKENYQNWQ